MSGRGKMFYVVITVAVGIIGVICFTLAAFIYLFISIFSWIPHVVTFHGAGHTAARHPSQ